MPGFSLRAFLQQLHCVRQRREHYLQILDRPFRAARQVNDQRSAPDSGSRP